MKRGGVKPCRRNGQLCAYKPYRLCLQHIRRACKPCCIPCNIT